jgi:starch synthase (maltosyl-transferring)
MIPVSGQFAPKIYYFHPLVAGPFSSWSRHLDRCRELGFDHVLTAPIFAPGSHGDIFITADHERAHPAFESAQHADDLVGQFAALCRERELNLLLDVVVGCVDAQAELAMSSPSWFSAKTDHVRKVDPRTPFTATQAVYARFDDTFVAPELAQWWSERLSGLAAAGASGFRCVDTSAVPPNLWRDIIAPVRDRHQQCRFLAWTPSLDWPHVAALRGVGFAASFSSVFRWDGRANWLVQEHELIRSVGTVIGCPEQPFGPRLARCVKDEADTAMFYRHMLRRAAATSSGLMVPMGFEYAEIDDLDRRRHQCSCEFLAATTNSAVTAAILEANQLVDILAALGIGGEMRALVDSKIAATGLLRSDASDIRNAKNAILVAINGDLKRSRELPFALDPLPPAAGAALAAREIISGDRDANGALSAGEIRIFLTRRSSAVKLRRPDVRPAKLAALPRIVIEGVTPTVDSGRFSAKCVVGADVSVEADIFIDGHDILAAEVLWRPADESEWQRRPMQLLSNDHWRSSFTPKRIGLYQFTIEAWLDKYGSICRDIEIKRAAATDFAVEIAEARSLLEAARERSEGEIQKRIALALEQWSGGDKTEIILASDLRAAMQKGPERHFHHRHEPAFPLEVERPQAAFASWYELFPRSATDKFGRHGTFNDVIGRLPAIRDMGFDVLYLPPIHPIGKTNRKGRNNSLNAEPGDVGSVYAIGNEAGGHDSIHPELGTIEDLRRLRNEAVAHGLELALDFAIQCSPDHPWLKQHRGWFNWRPDGSVRCAENPPKKYEDIVNVDFYQSDAIPHLWTTLRDIVLFWAGEGVRIFRVDNPHTKPLPFWGWMIAQVRARHPDVIFLSEAFTRPRVMYRLAKLGFSQSYTYFTWRNTKQDLTDYLTELTTSDVKYFFRPHFFVNTPDINPYFLQNSGRPGFLIRAALAATLSGLWGIYSGFELCEATPLPGREEYLDSEKYEIRIRDYDALGNIKTEIARLNQLRRSHPALQSHLGLRFYPAFNDNIIYYGKLVAADAQLILVAVNLDPFHAQEANIEVPLWEWGLADDASVDVEDLMRGFQFIWTGKLQRIRLDPTDLPFAIWRIAPTRRG